MRTRPEQDRALLNHDARALRDCAVRLEALTGALPAEGGRDWNGALAALAVLAGRCRHAAAELETAAELFADRAAGRSATAGAPAGAHALLRRCAAANPLAVAGAAGRLGRAWPRWAARAAANAHRPLDA